MADQTLASALEREHHEIDLAIEAYLITSGGERGRVEYLTQAMTALRRHIYLARSSEPSSRADACRKAGRAQTRNRSRRQQADQVSREDAAMTEGLVTRTSAHAFAETLERLQLAIAAIGFRVFARIDHRAAAREHGLELPATTVLVFGNPSVGTPAMLTNPLAALELPLRVLVREDGDEVLVSFEDPGFVARRFGIPVEVPAHAEEVVRRALAP